MQEQLQGDLPPLPGRLQQVVRYIVEEARAEDWSSSLGEEDDTLDRRLELTGRHLHILAFAILRELAEGYCELVASLETLQQTAANVGPLTLNVVKDLTRRVEDLQAIVERKG